MMVRASICLGLLFFVVLAPISANDLDLREANVVGVEYSESNREFNFDVTLIHDDDGESPNYANLWIIEDINGTELVRRELLHSHNTQEFTRSASGDIPEQFNYLIVRAHDQIHGWGGQAALINLGISSILFVDQGEELQNFTVQDFKSIRTNETYTSGIQSSSDQARSTLTLFLPIMFFFILIRRANGRSKEI